MAMNDTGAAADSSASADNEAHGPAQAVGAPAWIEHQAGPPGGEATRHLQAATHLNRAFRDRVITELVEERHRVPAPTPGVDPAAVLAEALRARRHTLWTALACFLVLLVGLAFDQVGALFALGAVLQVLLWGTVARGGVWLVVRLEPGFDTPEARKRVRRVILSVFWALYLVELSFGFAFLAALSGSGSSGYDGYGGDTGYGGYGGYSGYAGTAPFGTAGGIGMPVVLVVVWLLIGAISRYLRLQRLAEIGDPASAEPTYQPPASLREVFERLRSGTVEAETVFGSYRPFVGSGLSVNEWRLHTELRPAEVGQETTPLTVAQVHEQIAAWVRGLAAGADYPGDALHALAVRDRVFRSGLRVEPAQSWLGTLSPVGPDGLRALDPGVARELDAAAHPRLRHYLEARAELWNGQLVVSTFVRVTLQGHQLYLEGLEYLLPPVAERYREVDQALRPDGFDFLRCVWTALTHIGRDLFDNTAGVVAAAASGLRGWSALRWRARMLAHGRKVDHAPRVSLRELGADDRYEVLFQHLDARRVWSAVAERTQTSVVAVLKQNGYSTEQFEAAMQNITINNGIQNYNSTVSGAQASGSGAKASAHPVVPMSRMGTD